jgi:nucleoporin NUP82
MYLQQYELPRLTKKCQEMESILEEIQGPGRASTEDRLAKVQEEQKLLLARLDRLLQSLMEKASPELSEHEAKWFEELKRMKESVLGRGKYDEDSLVCRTRLLEKEFARLLPALQKLGEKEKRQGKKMAEVSQNMGFSQAFEYGEQSNLDRTRIASLQKQIIKLAGRVDTPIARPPNSP